MKKYLSILILFGLLLVPAMSKAQVSSTVEKRVVPVLKKSYETATKQSPSVSSAPRSVLKQGMKGEDVRYMQAWLYNQGYDIDIDGAFGPGTKRALIAFQKSTKGALSTDGVFGPRTALYIQDLPTGIAVKNLDNGTVDYLKGKHIATVSGKEVNSRTITASSKIKTAPTSTSKSVIAKLPKDVKSVLAKALPKAPTLTQVAVASSSSTTPKTVTKKPKAAIAALLSKSKVSLVTSGNVTNNLVASANLNTNFSKGEAGKATGEYICAEFSGDNMCAAVSAAIAAAIRAGQLDAKDVLAEILGNDGNCPFCSTNDNGGINVTSGGGCGAGGGPGSGEFITPDGTPVGTDPDACIPLADIAGKAYSLAVTSDNVFTAYWGVKGTDGSETLQVIGKDMNWDEQTPNSTGTQPGWKSGETYSGTAPANPANVYFAAFHDGWVTHGFLASLTVGGEAYETGNKVFEVTKTTEPGPVHPNDFDTTKVLNQIKNATWAQTFLVGDGEHGMSPWGVIAGIPLSAKWIFEGSDWDPEGLMKNYEIYKLKVCTGDTTPTATVDDLCMNFRTDESGNPTNGKSYYKVTFSESMIATGSPRLLIKKNATAPTVTAVFDGYADADHKVLKFVADIGSGLNNNIDSPYYEGVGTIEQVNGSTIKTVLGGKNAPTAVGTFLFTDTCGSTTTTLDITITEDCRGDAAWPTAAQQVNAHVNFGVATKFTGTAPQLKIKRQSDGADGIVLNYLNGSGNSVWNFTYIVPDPLPPNFIYTKPDFEGSYKFKLAPGTVIQTVNGNATVNVDGELVAPPGNLCPVPDATSYDPSEVAQMICFTKKVTGNSGQKVATLTIGTDKTVVVNGTPKIKAWSLDANPPPQVLFSFTTGNLTKKLKFTASQAGSNATDDSFDFTNINKQFQFDMPAGSSIKTLSDDGLQLYPNGIALGSPNLPECAP